LDSGNDRAPGAAGIPDIAVGSPGIWTFLGNGNGTFTESSYSPAAGGYPAVSGDFNSDGKMDVATGGPNTALILLGKGDGTFQTQVLFLVGCGPVAMVVADFNNDGKPDLATANSCSNNVTILTNTTQHAGELTACR
jgi:hypothetical protein